jgi:hypothetical protein
MRGYNETTSYKKNTYRRGREFKAKARIPTDETQDTK